jgi:hypothetical protein
MESKQIDPIEKIWNEYLHEEDCGHYQCLRELGDKAIRVVWSKGDFERAIANGDLFTKEQVEVERLKAKIEELNFIIQVCYGDVELVKALKGKRDSYKEKLEKQLKEMKG